MLEDYRYWKDLDYTPASRDVVPASLAGRVHAGQRALDVGCHHGAASFFMASIGLRVLGIDINPRAVEVARRQRPVNTAGRWPEFVVADFLVDRFAEPTSFDVVVLNRFLTCLPAWPDWQSGLERAQNLLVDGGVIYVNDFLLMPASDHNRGRYVQGYASGGRWGNFTVVDAQDQASFVAHHHSAQELRRIAAPYRLACLRRYSTRSRNGYPSRMFELIGVLEARPLRIG
ncbi:class I SAM-dependent methyltransferase [Candidatus Accumulibacter vicinus]|uniref:Putative methyltransferase n=1 Tax=Candidatus Accumulibacter vicinus TaxID=2954382 RepID=A0A084Y2N2_9PROT|nr:class I SAM-dependent methyltransferase [Candidatus Accumulibacter vicinus]KFB68976.1 MAG: putative methyltransferase [Candidatus Accumulibacter vicinus]